MFLDALNDLKLAGYVFQTDGTKVTYLRSDPSVQTTEWALERLQILRQYRGELIAHLQSNFSPAPKLVAVDIETTGLNPRKDKIRLVAVASKTESYVVDDTSKVATLLADPLTLKVFHNAIFDVGFFQAKGYPVINYTDTMVMGQLLDQNKGSHSLSSMAKEYLDISIDKTLQSNINWQGPLTQAHRDYCRNDAEVTLQLALKLLTLLETQNLTKTLDIEMAALPAIVRLQSDGMPFDAKGWQADLSIWSAQKDALAADILKELGSTINLASPMQLKACLQNRGVDIVSTADEELAKFVGDFPVIAKIRKWREIHKIVTSFGREMVQKTEADGRIYANWRLIGATTGRMTCSNPNIQQMPHILRPYFRAAPGNIFVIADYSQIELRVIASLSGDTTMQTAFLKDEDLHVNTARLILNKDNVSKAERQVAKTANFGLIYGMSAYGLQNRVKTQYALDLSEQEAERFRTGFFRLYKGIRRWQERQLQRSQIKTRGGRSWNNLSKAEWRNRFNYPVQGTAAEGLKASLPVLLSNLLPHWKLCALVHDEVVLEVPEHEAPAAVDIVRNCLVQGMSTLIPDVPIRVDVSTHKSWKKD